jgi:hypothetical protein
MYQQRNISLLARASLFRFLDPLPRDLIHFYLTRCTDGPAHNRAPFSEAVLGRALPSSFLVRGKGLKNCPNTRNCETCVPYMTNTGRTVFVRPKFFGQGSYSRSPGSCVPLAPGICAAYCRVDWKGHICYFIRKQRWNSKLYRGPFFCGKGVLLVPGY